MGVATIGSCEPSYCIVPGAGVDAAFLCIGSDSIDIGLDRCALVVDDIHMAAGQGVVAQQVEHGCRGYFQRRWVCCLDMAKPLNCALVRRTRVSMLDLKNNVRFLAVQLHELKKILAKYEHQKDGPSLMSQLI
jgi:hypothetical protein